MHSSISRGSSPLTLFLPDSELPRSPADGIDTLKPQLPNDRASLNRKSSRTVSAQDPSLAPTDVSPERPKKKRSLLLRPSRSSSKLNRHSTERTAAEEPGNTDANMKKRRDTSRASSRRSRRNHQETVSNAEGPKGATPDVDHPSKAEKKSRTSLRLFAFLNCCSSSSVDHEDPALPPKTVKPQPVPGRQGTPEKIDANAGDSSTSESKEPNSFDDEKTNLTVTAGRPQSQAEDEKCASVGEQGAATRPQDDGTSSGVDGSGSVNDQPSSQGRKPETLDQGSSHTLPSSTSMKAGVTAGADSTDVFTKIPEEDVVSSARVQVSEGASDDTDVPMAEAPVIDDSVEDDEAQPSHDGIMQQSVDLPPPPPLVPSGKPAPPGSLDGRQQWLLPPPQPHLQNRKCLVLDLDETLVHSSFKVLTL